MIAPTPLLLKIPGTVAAIDTGCSALFCPLNVTCAVMAALKGTLKGICALICPDDTKNKGAGYSVAPEKKEIDVPLMFVESGKLNPACVCEARFAPNADTNMPGD